MGLSKSSKWDYEIINYIIIGLLLIFCVFSFVCVGVKNLGEHNRILSSDLTVIKEKREQYIRYDFVDQYGNIVFADDKQYATMIQELDAYGRVIFEDYFDENGNPAKQVAGYYGLIRKYNDLGDNYLIITTDQKRIPMLCSRGYAIVVRDFDDKGHILVEKFYDTNEKPIMNDKGVYGYCYEYDNSGNIIVETGLDKYYMPTTNKYGYVSVRYYYDDSEKYYMYYGINGEPISIGNGQYGIKTINGKTVYLNKNGKEQFSIELLFKQFPGLVICISLLISVLIAFVNKFLKIIIGFCIVFIILYLTLWRSNSGAIISFPLDSYKYFFINDAVRIEIIDNIWLFVPFGAWLFSTCQKWRVVVIPIILSLFVECCQLIFQVGWFEFDDIINNALGGIIGVAIIYEILFIKDRNKVSAK